MTGTAATGTAVHLAEFGGPSGAVMLVLVHGLGGSHLNWDLLAPRLTGRAHVVAVDLPGFGLSPPHGRPATVRSNVAALADVVRGLGPPAVVVGNSMGGLIAILLAARQPRLVRGLVLLDPALPAPRQVLRSPADAATLALHALPGVGEYLRRAHLRRIGPRAAVDETLRRCGVDPDALPPDLLTRSVALAEHRSDVAGTDRAFLSASRSLAWTLLRARAYRAAMRAIRVPVLLMHGDRDPLVPVSAARATAARLPSWRYVELAGAGHLPQMQLPGTVAEHVVTWLDELPAARSR